MFAQDIFSRKKIGDSIALAIPFLNKNELTCEKYNNEKE